MAEKKFVCQNYGIAGLIENLSNGSTEPKFNAWVFTHFNPQISTDLYTCTINKKTAQLFMVAQQYCRKSQNPYNHANTCKNIGLIAETAENCSNRDFKRVLEFFAETSQYVMSSHDSTQMILSEILSFALFPIVASYCNIPYPEIGCFRFQRIYRMLCKYKAIILRVILLDKRNHNLQVNCG